MLFSSVRSVASLSEAANRSSTQRAHVKGSVETFRHGFVASLGILVYRRRIQRVHRILGRFRRGLPVLIEQSSLLLGGGVERLRSFFGHQRL